MNANEKKAQELILREINKALDLLEKHLQNYCDDVAVKFTGQKATSVPMIYISSSIKIIKENIVKGAK